MYERLRAGADSRLRCRSPPPRHPLSSNRTESCGGVSRPHEQATPPCRAVLPIARRRNRAGVACRGEPTGIDPHDSAQPIRFERLAEGRTERGGGGG